MFPSQWSFGCSYTWVHEHSVYRGLLRVYIIYIYIYMYIYFICMHFIKCKFEGHLVMHFIIYNYFKRQIFYHESFLSTKLCCRSEKFLLYFLIYNNKIIRSRINFALETTNFSLFRLAILSETAV